MELMDACYILNDVDIWVYFLVDVECFIVEVERVDEVVKFRRS